MAVIRVGDPLTLAISRTGVVLFRPFRFEKWLAMALVAWLAAVSEWRGMGILPNLVAGPIDEWIRGAGGFSVVLQKYLKEINCVLVGLAIVAFGVYLLFRWVNCRGEFMMLDAVVRNEGEIRESWRRNRAAGNSLLKFRIMWDLMLFNLFLLVIIVGAALIWPDIQPMLSGVAYEATAWTWWAVGVTAGGFLAASLVTFLANVYLHYYMVPVMYVRGMTAREAFRHSRREMFWRQKKASILYLLMVGLTLMVKAMAEGVAIYITCIGYVLSLIPLLGIASTYPPIAVALPIEVYVRAYSLYFVEQFGPEYRVAWSQVLPSGFPVILNEPRGEAMGDGAAAGGGGGETGV